MADHPVWFEESYSFKGGYAGPLGRLRLRRRSAPAAGARRTRTFPDDRKGRSYDGRVAETPRLITAAELDEMTPNERAQAFNERVVTDWEQVPEQLRQSIATTAAWLTEPRRRPVVE